MRVPKRERERGNTEKERQKNQETKERKGKKRKEKTSLLIRALTFTLYSFSFFSSFSVFFVASVLTRWLFLSLSFLISFFFLFLSLHLTKSVLDDPHHFDSGERFKGREKEKSERERKKKERGRVNESEPRQPFGKKSERERALNDFLLFLSFSFSLSPLPMAMCSRFSITFWPFLLFLSFSFSFTLSSKPFVNCFQRPNRELIFISFSFSLFSSLSSSFSLFLSPSSLFLSPSSLFFLLFLLNFSFLREEEKEEIEKEVKWQSVPSDCLNLTSVPTFRFFSLSLSLLHFFFSLFLFDVKYRRNGEGEREREGSDWLNQVFLSFSLPSRFFLSLSFQLNLIRGFSHADRFFFSSFSFQSTDLTFLTPLFLPPFSFSHCLLSQSKWVGGKKKRKSEWVQGQNFENFSWAQNSISHFENVWN